MLTKVMAVQMTLGRKPTLEEKLHIFRQRPEFICLPEYCMIDGSVSDYVRAAMAIKENIHYLRGLSEEFSCLLVAGSVVEGEADMLFNTCHVFDRGNSIGRYRKINPVDGEIKKGIVPGDKVFTAFIEDIKIAVLICADALNPALFEALADYDIDIIFIPTTSPYRPAESKAQKYKRDNDIYVRGARRACAYVVKTCGVGTLFGKPLQGRSLIASPWEIIRRVPVYAEDQPQILTAVLDIDEIREFRAKTRKTGNPRVYSAPDK